MPECLSIIRDYKQPEKYTISNKDWNSPRFSEEEATKIAVALKGEVQFRPADAYFGQAIGQVGQRDAGYIVKVGCGYLYSINKELCGIK